MTRGRVIAALIALALIAAAAFAFFRRPSLPDRPSEKPTNVPLTWADVRSASGHVAHVEKKGVACRECHDESNGKMTARPVDACYHCHEKQAKKTHTGDEAHATTCTQCHGFSKEGPTCQSCHDKAMGKQAAVGVHASADASCASCHGPHSPASSRQGDCAACHATIKQVHGALAMTSDDAKAKPVPATKAHGETHTFYQQGFRCCSNAP